MNKSLEVEVKVGFFVAIGFALIMLTIILLGGSRSLFTQTVSYYTRFSHVDGIVSGALVKLSGVNVGQVDDVEFEKNTGLVKVHFSVKAQYKDAIHQDCSVTFATQGVLGDKYIVLNGGNPTLPALAPTSEIQSVSPKDLKETMNNADDVILKLKTSLGYMETILGNFARDNRSDMFFRNMSLMSSNMNSATTVLPAKMQDFYSTLGHMNSVMNKIDRGDGTLGALINDPSLYEDLKTLMGGANRNKVLKYFVRKSVEESRETSEKAK